jgi:tetratricopeptide (TPR) repeat protein
MTGEHGTSGERALALLGLLPLLLAVDLLRSRNVEVDRGNAALKAGKAEEALQAYYKAAETLPKDPGVHFNRGSALYNLQRYEDAAQAFLRATEARPAPLKASAFYNLGNSFAKASKWGEAVEAYKKSLVYAPKDIKTKWNLELALRKKRDEDKQKQDNKDGQKKDDKQDDKGEEAKNDPSQSGDQNAGDKEGEGDRNAEDDQKKDQE